MSVLIYRESGVLKSGRIRISVTLLFLAIICAVASNGYAAGNEWAWMKGSNTWSHGGVYGTKGLEAPENQPGAREHAVSWTDPSGNLWMFGGLGQATPDGPNPSGRLNDLWKYNPQTGNWTWMKGSNTPDSRGVHGPLNVEAAEYEPGARQAAVSWVDNEGNLWLFGGYGWWSTYSGYLNDLWRYNPATGNWAKMERTSPFPATGSYGTQKVESADSYPGARMAAMSWTDNSGNLWLFGGLGDGAKNDLWRYNPLTGNWAWMKGAPGQTEPGTYGTEGVEAEANTPGARSESATWTDMSGNLWLFGGFGLSSWSQGYLSDLWKFDVHSNNWTFMRGSTQPDQTGVYGERGVETLANRPGGRESAVGWTDNAGNLWLFGGLGRGDSVSGLLNDMWRCNLQTGNWTWMQGSKSVYRSPVHGTKGVAAPENTPGGRERSVGWKDNTGAFWLFGATTIWNDLWQYQPLSSGIPWDQMLNY